MRVLQIVLGPADDDAAAAARTLIPVLRGAAVAGVAVLPAEAPPMPGAVATLVAPVYPPTIPTWDRIAGTLHAAIAAIECVLRSDEDFDIVHAHGWPSAHAGSAVAEIRAVPFVLSAVSRDHADLLVAALSDGMVAMADATLDLTAPLDAVLAAYRGVVRGPLGVAARSGRVS